MTYRILVTGSRHWADETIIRDVLAETIAGAVGGTRNGDIVLVSGNSIGADRIAEKIMHGWHYPIECHPADWSLYGRAAGPIRNQAMVDLGANICLAFPLGISRGTNHCIGAACVAGIPVQITRWSAS